jgi:hypothetical protein
MDKARKMKRNIAIRSMILVVISLVLAHETHSSSVFNLANIDSALKKVELIPVMINGEKDNRINIVIMNRWSSRYKEPYNSQAMRHEFLKDINESLIAVLTPGDKRAQTVFASYRHFFNVYGLWWPDITEWGKGVDQNTVKISVLAVRQKKRIWLKFKETIAMKIFHA